MSSITGCRPGAVTFGAGTLRFDPAWDADQVLTFPTGETATVPDGSVETSSPSARPLAGRRDIERVLRASPPGGRPLRPPAKDRAPAPPP